MTAVMMIERVAGATAANVDRIFGALLRASATHSGQCCPTVAGIAQRPQIGRSQRLQRRRVGVSGCP